MDPEPDYTSLRTDVTGMLPRAFALLIVLALCPAAARAQQAGPGVVVYTVQDLSSAATTHEYEQTLTDAVTAAFDAAHSFRVVSRQEWQARARSLSLKDRDLLSGPAAGQLARGVSADLAVSGTYTVVGQGSEEQIVVSLECWEAGSGRLAGGFVKSARFDLGFFVLLRGWLQEMIEGLAAVVPAGDGVQAPSGPVVPRVGEITFLSPDEGMEISLAGEASAGIISGGRLSFPTGGIAEGSLLHVTKRKRGFHDSTETVRAASEIRLAPLAKTSAVALSLSWDIRAMLGAGATLRWYPVADELYVAVGAYGFVQPPVSTGPRVALHGDFSLGLGGYLFFPPEAKLRLSAETGAGVVLSGITVPGLPLYTDLYLSPFSLSVETSLLGVPLSLRVEPRYALGVGTNLIPRGWIEGPPLLILGVLFRW